MEIVVFGREFSAAMLRQLHQKSAGLTKSWGWFSYDAGLNQQRYVDVAAIMDKCRSPVGKETLALVVLMSDQSKLFGHWRT